MPGKTEEKKSKNGTGSGSWRQLLQQKSQSEESKYRQTIQTVCEKMTTLKTGDMGNVEDYNTFVYKGGDSDEELEAEGTMLDNSLLKQYTEQLETFVFKGFDDNDSDYFTGGSLGNKGLNKKGNDEATESEDEGDVSSTLIRQYSETLAFNDDAEEGTIVNSGNDNLRSSVDGPVPNVKGDIVNSKVRDSVKTTGNVLGELESDDEEDNFDATIDPRFSKYQYKGLKDTMALRPDKRWKKQHSDPNEWFTPLKEDEEKRSKRISEENRYEVPKSLPTKGSKSVTILSSTGTITSTREQVEDPRLLQTLEGHSLKKTRAPKVPVSDRIQQSVISREEANKLKSPKKEITKVDNCAGAPATNAKRVVSHLKDYITPFLSVDTNSEKIQAGVADISKSQVIDNVCPLLNVTKDVTLWFYLFR